MAEIIAKIPIQDTRLFYKKWDNFENLNNLLKTEIEAEREKDPKGLPATNAGCWRSMMKYKCEAELMKPIGMILSAYMDHYFPKKPMDAAINYWTNVNEVGSNNIFHSHYRADADISGVYYVQGNKSPINFHSNDKNVFPIKLNFEEYKIENSTSYWIDMEPHKLFLFPSSLEHSVDNNDSDVTRISISFNTFVKGTFGTELGLDKLELGRIWK